MERAVNQEEEESVGKRIVCVDDQQQQNEENKSKLPEPQAPSINTPVSPAVTTTTTTAIATEMSYNNTFQILEFEESTTFKGRVLKVNRLPTLEDFLWEKVYEIDPTVKDIDADDETHEDYFWLIGTMPRLQLKIVYFATERDHIGPARIVLQRLPPPPQSEEDSSKSSSTNFHSRLLIVDRHELHHNYGVTDRWQGDMVKCVCSDPKNEKDKRTLYLYC